MNSPQKCEQALDPEATIREFRIVRREDIQETAEESQIGGRLPLKTLGGFSPPALNPAGR